jgi:hypothetical protein
MNPMECSENASYRNEYASEQLKEGPTNSTQTWRSHGHEYKVPDLLESDAV